MPCKGSRFVVIVHFICLVGKLACLSRGDILGMGARKYLCRINCMCHKAAGFIDVGMHITITFDV